MAEGRGPKAEARMRGRAALPPVGRRGHVKKVGRGIGTGYGTHHGDLLQQPVKSRDAHVIKPLDRHARQLQGDCGLLRHREIRGARAQHCDGGGLLLLPLAPFAVAHICHTATNAAHTTDPVLAPSAGRRQRGDPRRRVVDQPRYLGGKLVVHLLRNAGRHGHHVFRVSLRVQGVLAPHHIKNVADLWRGLPLAEDHFGQPCARASAVINPREPLDDLCHFLDRSACMLGDRGPALYRLGHWHLAGGDLL
mmetsp:Transcript_89316/g.254995  ORF Transcript_89316/g.254995 Transcript_89316/m.254995 type:complete len:250 (+) Transcript_89316:435-1184(+)